MELESTWTNLNSIEKCICSITNVATICLSDSLSQFEMMFDFELSSPYTFLCLEFIATSSCLSQLSPIASHNSRQEILQPFIAIRVLEKAVELFQGAVEWTVLGLMKAAAASVTFAGRNCTSNEALRG